MWVKRFEFISNADIFFLHKNININIAATMDSRVLASFLVVLFSDQHSIRQDAFLWSVDTYSSAIWISSDNRCIGIDMRQYA